MADNKRRILIVDDDLFRHTDMNGLFNKCGVDVEVGYAWNLEKAQEILEGWLREGNRPHIITADDNRLGPEGGDTAANVLHTLLTLCENRGAEFLPDKFYVHSAGGAGRTFSSKWGESGRFDSGELVCMGAWGSESKSKRQSIMHDSRLFYLTRLREYCNENWGTNFILSEAAFNFKKDPQQKFDAPWICHLVEEKNATPEEGLGRIDPADDFFIERSYVISDVSCPSIRFKDATGEPVVGRVAYSEADIEDLLAQDPTNPIVLCLEEYSPGVIPLFKKIHGVVLMGEGREHLKIVADNQGLAAVMGIDSVEEDCFLDRLSFENGRFVHYNRRFNEATKNFDITSRILSVGDFITIEKKSYDSSSYEYGAEPKTIVNGVLVPERLELQTSCLKQAEWYADFMGWADDARRKYTNLKILANADNAEQVAQALEDGAEGIGLLRTEHMFFERERLSLLQEAALASDEARRQSALADLKTLHKIDLTAVYNAAARGGGVAPVAVRLLDAPPAEFLDEAQIASLEARVGAGNMRGVQLAVQTPGLYRMQIEAAFEAAEAAGYGGEVEIMIPLVRTAAEVAAVHKIADEVAEGRSYKFGAMIETLDAVENIQEIAALCDFLSVGSNDLMAEIMGGIERHDIAAINLWMAENGESGESPFRRIGQTLEKKIEQIIAGAREANPDVKISACGQQMGEDYAAAEMAIRLGLDAISVSRKFLDRSRANAGYYAVKRNNPDVAAREEDPFARVDPWDVLGLNV